MFSQYFGEYLLKNNQITPNQFDKVMEYQNTNRAKLGLIAVLEGLLTPAQADELNRLQATQDKRFGDLAVENGYLTESDITNLLRLQGNPYLTFIQALEENGVKSKEEAEVILADFQKERHFSNSDLVAIKNADIDYIISIFVNIENTMIQSLINLSIKNIMRFVTTHFRIEHAYVTKNYSANHIAYQKAEGDHNVFLAFASDDDSLLMIAENYGKENFDQVDEDALDAICEFINCINGLYATQLSHENVDIDMLPPGYSVEKTSFVSDEIIVVPVYLEQRKVDLILSFDHPIQFE